MLSRDFGSMQRVWAFWVMGLLCYIPANAYPMLKTRTLFQVDESTIVGGHHPASVGRNPAGQVLGHRLSGGQRQKTQCRSAAVAPCDV
jgi:hypothetical protein